MVKNITLESGIAFSQDFCSIWSEGIILFCVAFPHFCTELWISGEALDGDQHLQQLQAGWAAVRLTLMQQHIHTCQQLLQVCNLREKYIESIITTFPSYQKKFTHTWPVDPFRRISINYNYNLFEVI